MTSVRKHICLSLIVIILLIPYYAEAARGIAVRPISPSGAEVKGNQWLFVIGIDTYIVYDGRTKLLWVKDGNYFGKKMTWDNAKKACKKLVIAGLSGWRLPTQKELESLVDKYYTPTINPVFNCMSSNYWSSTTC